MGRDPVSQQCYQAMGTDKSTLTTTLGRVAAAKNREVPAIPADLTAAAFFDLDNTMMRGASIFYFAQGLAARKFFPAGALTSFAWQQLKFRVVGKELSLAQINTSREQALSFVAGRSSQQFVDLGEDIYDELMANRIWSGTLALARAHLDAGQRVWLVTATPQELATIIAQRLGLTGAVGTVAETADGMYTGRLVGDILHGAVKAQAVRALASKEGLDLQRCTAYSDSANDIPMLSVVGTAVAINPDSQLYQTARERGWEIRDFRTGRKAARIGGPLVGIGVAAGAVAAGLAYQRRSQPLIRAGQHHVHTKHAVNGGSAASRATALGPLPLRC